MKKNLILVIAFFLMVNALAPGMLAARGSSLPFAGLEACRPVLQRFFSLCVQPSVRVAALLSGQPIADAAGESDPLPEREDGNGAAAAADAPRLILSGERRLVSSLSYSGGDGPLPGIVRAGASFFLRDVPLRDGGGCPMSPAPVMLLCIIFSCLLARGALPSSYPFSVRSARGRPHTSSRHRLMACRVF